MKTKLVTFAISLFIALSICSCKKEQNLNESTYKLNESFVSLDEATQIALNIDLNKAVASLTEKNQMYSVKSKRKRSIHNTTTITDGNTPYFYVSNYEDGGYSIVPADNRLLPVMAFSELGNFNIDSMPPGLLYWFEANADNIQNLNKSNSLQLTNIARLWDIAKSYVQPIDPLVDPGGEPIPDNPVTITVGPLLRTQWHQGCGFNDLCPVLTNGTCGHAYTGCGTTAVGQVMAYWQYPSSYSWSAMSNTGGSNEAARLMGDLFPYIIDTYDETGSGCKNDYNLRHAFLSFGYTSASLAGYVNGITENGGYNYQTVKSNLASRQPVILGAYSDYKKILFVKYPSGAGHLWVCDGYMESVYSTATYLYFHMNWGQGPNSPTWVAFDNWNYSSTRSYNYFRDMIFNIHP